MNIYYRYDTKKLCDAAGTEIYNTNYYPRFPVQSSVAVDWYFLRLNRSTNTIEAVDVSFVSAWSLALDKDFASATNVMARAENTNINSNDAAHGHLSAVINTNTEKFISVTDGHDTVPCYGQLKALNSFAQKIEAFKFPIIADGDLDLSVDPPPANITNYYTKAESDGRYLLKSRRIETLGAYVINANTDVTVGNGKWYFPPVPSSFDRMKLIIPGASVIIPGITNATTVQIYNVTKSVDMLSSAISIPSEATKGTGTVDTSNNTVAAGDILRVDVDSASDTAPKGLLVTLDFNFHN